MINLYNDRAATYSCLVTNGNEVDLSLRIYWFDDTFNFSDTTAAMSRINKVKFYHVHSVIARVTARVLKLLKLTSLNSLGSSLTQCSHKLEMIKSWELFSNGRVSSDSSRICSVFKPCRGQSTTVTLRIRDSAKPRESSGELEIVSNFNWNIQNNYIIFLQILKL